MEQEFVKVGPSPDFIMTMGKLDFFHSVAIKVADVSGRIVESRSIANRSFKAMTFELRNLIENRFRGEKFTVQNTQQEGIYIAIGLERTLRLKYRITEGLNPKNVRTLLNELKQEINSFSSFSQNSP